MGNRDTQGHVKTKPEARVMHLQDKELQELLAAPRRQDKGMKQILPQSSQKEPTLTTLGFWTSGLRN